MKNYPYNNVEKSHSILFRTKIRFILHYQTGLIKHK